MEQLVPAHLVQAEKGHPIRVLSLGCSTGEEPYSIAIALRERYGDLAERLVRITAGDVDEAALEHARTFDVVSELIRSVVDLAETPDTQAPALADLLGLARPYLREDTQRLLGDLKHLWIALAMDDFGTGDSSLAYLEGLPFDTLKIDRSFISGLPDDPAGAGGPIAEVDHPRAGDEPHYPVTRATGPRLGVTT